MARETHSVKPDYHEDDVWDGDGNDLNYRDDNNKGNDDDDGDV